MLTLLLLLWRWSVLDTSHMGTSAALGAELGTISGLVCLMGTLIILYLVKQRFFWQMEHTHTLIMRVPFSRKNVGSIYDHNRH
jgi:hypothetical protein